MKIRGFTLIELIIVIGILAILTTLAMSAINPGRQFALARNTKRSSDTRAIANALEQYAAANSGAIPSGITLSPQNIGTSYLDLTSVLVPNYIASIPADPQAGNAANTRYVVFKDNSNRVSVVAVNAELGRTIGAGLTPNTAAQFTATSGSNLLSPDSPSLSIGGTDFTFSGWVYFDDLSSSHPVVSKSGEYMLWYEGSPSNALRWRVWEADGTIRNAQLTGIQANKWFFFVASYVEATKVIALKLNNSTTAAFTMPTAPAAQGNVFFMGRYSAGGYHQGRIDNVGFWKRELSTQEQAELYNGGYGKTFSQLGDAIKANMISWWNLDEDTGTRKDAYGLNHLIDNYVTDAPGV